MKRLLILSLILMGLVGSASAAFNPADYSYYEDFYVNSTTAQTDYQVRMILSNATDYSTTSPWYTNGTTRDDWLDVAWTDTDNDIIPFWKENRTDTATNSSWWMNISSIADDNTTEIRVHYGDADAAESYADGAASFPIFDDFDGTDFSDLWVDSTSGQKSFSDSIVTISTNDNTNARQFYSVSTYSQPYVMRSRLKTAHFGLAGQEIVGFDVIATAHGQLIYFAQDGGGAGKYCNYDGGVHYADVLGWSADTYYTIDIIRNGTIGSIFKVNDGYTVILNDGYDYAASNLHFYTMKTGSSISVDWTFIRKYTPVEPFLTYKPKPPTVITASFNLVLTDTSTGTPTSWQWNATNLLGNNTPVTISTDQNPILTLTQGNWLIDLIATNDVGSDSANSTIGINLTSPQVYFWERTS